MGRSEQKLYETVGLETARRTDPLNPWSPRMLRLYEIVVVAFMCSYLNGELTLYLIWISEACRTSKR